MYFQIYQFSHLKDGEICITTSVPKNLENMVLLLAFIQKQSAYLNIFSYINSEFKGTQKILFTEQKYHQ